MFPIQCPCLKDAHSARAAESPGYLEDWIYGLHDGARKGARLIKGATRPQER